MKKKIILFDLDGVFYQYDKKLLLLAHERFDLPLYSPEDVIDFNTELIFPKEFHEQVEALSHEPGFFRGLEPFVGAIEAFKEANEHPDIEAFICTAPKRFAKNPTCAQEKFEAVAEHFGVDVADRIIMTRDKTLVVGDVLIDDKPEVKGVCEPTWKHVYYDRPYNRNSDQPRITDWSTWKETVFPILFP